MRAVIGVAALAALGAAQPLAAQDGAPRVFVEALAGAAVPTFDIADVAKAGPAFGAAVGIRLSPRWVVLGEFDYGMHEDEPTGTVDINTLHYIGKVGYSLTGPRERGWEAIVNLGAGAVTFDVENAPSSFTYFAINAGAKLSYSFNRSVAFVISPQGDIAFSDAAELGTDNAWVWPVTAGLRFNF
ncbi:MAG TPA: outer membrane beta-barrel protein [Longimicrobiales bacterium]